MSWKEFYYKEWKLAEKDGDTLFADMYKACWEVFVIEDLTNEHTMYYSKLSRFPLIHLN